MSHRHLKKVTYTKSNIPYHYVMYMSLTQLGTYSIVFICHIYYVKANVININNYLLQSCHILWMYTTSGSNSRYLNKSENLKPATSRKKIPQQKFASYLVRFIFSRLHVDIPLHDLQSYHVFQVYNGQFLSTTSFSSTVQSIHQNLPCGLFLVSIYHFAYYTSLSENRYEAECFSEKNLLGAKPLLRCYDALQI